MSDTVFADTETTGFTNADELLSMAFVSSSGATLLDTYVRPVHKTAWPEAQKVNKITPAFIFNPNYNFQRAATFYEAVREIVHERRVIFYGADFDQRMISKSFPPGLFHKSEVICCMNRFTYFIKTPDNRTENRGRLRRYSLVAAAEECGYVWPDLLQPHGALADALATKHVWDFMDASDQLKIQTAQKLPFRRVR